LSERNGTPLPRFPAQIRIDDDSSPQQIAVRLSATIEKLALLLEQNHAIIEQNQEIIKLLTRKEPGQETR